MTITPTNILVGAGILYLGAFGATEPADSAINTSPAASAWTDAGGTDGGLTFTAAQAFYEAVVDQATMPVARALTTQNVKLKTSLAEATLENLKYALNGGTIATGANYKTYDPDLTGGQVTPIAAIFDGVAPGGFRRRFIARKVHSLENVEQAYKKDGMVLVPVSLGCLYVSSVIKPYHVIDQTS